MTKLEALAKDCIENHTHKLVDKPTKQDIYLREESIFIQGYRQSEERIAELEEKISILLSCKNCPENKGGYICEKEYENKCLSQKIVYIKELKKEKRKLLGIIRDKDKVIQELEKENAELTCQMKRNTFCYSCKNATERCYKKEIGCPCENYESYKKEKSH